MGGGVPPWHDSAARCQRTIELDSDFLPSWDVLKWIHIRRGDEKEAITAYLRVVELEGLHIDMLPRLREVAARDGRMDEMLKRVGLAGIVR